MGWVGRSLKDHLAPVPCRGHRCHLLFQVAIIPIPTILMMDFNLLIPIYDSASV